MKRWIHILMMSVLMLSQTGFTWVSACCETTNVEQSCHDQAELPACCSDEPADECCENEDDPIIINPSLIPFTIEDSNGFSFDWKSEESFAFVNLYSVKNHFTPFLVQESRLTQKRHLLFQNFRC